MATYADLKTRIVTETNRDDLTDDPAAASLFAIHISNAVDEYADQRFWFNQVIQSLTTTANVNSITLSTPLRIVDRLAGPYGDLTPTQLSDFPDYGDTPVSPGLPWEYAYYDNTLRFNRTPDQAYAMRAYGIMQVDAPVNDADSNIWTNEAAALIAAHTRMTLFRDYFRDVEGTGLAANAVQMHLTKLKRETERRLRPRAAAQLVAPNGQSVRKPWLDRL